MTGSERPPLTLLPMSAATVCVGDTCDVPTGGGSADAAAITEDASAARR